MRFRDYSPVAATLVALGCLPAQTLAQAQPLVIRNLTHALELAREKSPALRQARERAVKTRKTIDQILSARNPQISGRGTYTRLFNGGSGFGGGGGGSLGAVQNPFPALLQNSPPGSQPIPLASGSGGATSRAVGTRAESGGTTTTGGSSFGSGVDLNQESLSLSVTQSLDLGGVIRLARQIGDVELQIQTLELQRTQQETALTVKSGYYALLRAQALVGVAEASVAQSTEQIRVAEAQFKQGTVAQFDVLRARTQHANNQQNLISARNQLAVSKNAFANSLGVDPGTAIELQAITEAKEKEPLPDLDEKRLIEQALKDRPESQQVALAQDKATKNLRLVGRGLSPSLAAALSSNYNPNPAFIGDKQTGSVSLILSVPISDGGANRAQGEAARSDQRAVEIQADQYKRGIQAEVQQVIIAVKDAHERAQTAWESVEQAREAYRIALVRFREGVDTQLSVNDAQTALTQAETNIINARYDYLTALARLARALGKE